jgi:hypothetical protein
MSDLIEAFGSGSVLTIIVTAIILLLVPSPIFQIAKEKLGKMLKKETRADIIRILDVLKDLLEDDSVNGDQTLTTNEFISTNFKGIKTGLKNKTVELVFSKLENKLLRKAASGSQNLTSNLDIEMEFNDVIKNIKNGKIDLGLVK